MKIIRSNPKLLSRIFSLGFVALLGFAFLASLGIIPTTFAVTPVLDKTCKNSASAATSVSCTIASVPSGDVIIVAWQTANAASSTISDNGSNTYSLTVQTSCNGAANCAGGPFYLSSISCVSSPGIHGESITISQGSSTTLALEVYVVSNTGCSTTGTSSNSFPNAAGGSYQTTGSLVVASNQFALAGSYCGSCGNANPTVTTGFTWTASAGFSGAPAIGSEYCLSCSITTNFQIQYSGGALYVGSYVAAVFASANSQGTQTQTIGSCPTKNTNTFTMVNSTIYMYEGNALGSEVVNTISTFVASIVGSGSHTLRVVVYVSAGQSANINTPFVLAYQNTIVITSGTTNQAVNFQVNIPLNTAVANPLPFNLWGVGIVGDNKIKINQSSTSGLFTLSGNPSTQGQPASFTNGGTSSGTQLYLCGTGQYQSVLQFTSTSTQSATTTSTVLTTSTATISTIGSNLFSTSSNWPVIFLILVLPAGLFLGVTKTITGALLGLMIGAVIGQLMGILPPFIFVGLVISMVAVAFLARDRGG